MIKQIKGGLEVSTSIHGGSKPTVGRTKPH
jgi:hypothetical protein